MVYDKSNFEKIKKYISSRKCAVVGFGVSNAPLAEILYSISADFEIWDKKTPEELGEHALDFVKRGIVFHSGDPEFKGIDASLIFRSPGIRPDVKGISDALLRGAELISEIELFIKLCEAPVFALTGSDGKTTSTTLTGLFLERDRALRGEGRAVVGGNIGTPLLDLSGELGKSDRAVLELSSFQLMTFSREVSAKNVAITNISPNHLDWHLGMNEYVEAKKRIVGERTRRLVTNFDCEATRALAYDIMRENSEIEVIFFSSKQNDIGPLEENVSFIYERDGYIRINNGICDRELLSVRDVRVPGRHNLENFMTAIGLTLGEVDESVYRDVALEFRGVEHRLELFATYGTCDFFNSSIDSSPSRTAAALSALDGRDMVVICGGYDKKIPFEPLAEALFENSVRAVVLTGATADKIEAAIELEREKVKGALEVEREESFDEAVKKAFSLAKEGEAVVLSPACASFDSFKNFAERGRHFKRLVLELIEEN